VWHGRRIFDDVPNKAAVLRPGQDQRHVRAADRQPLREQLRRGGETPQPDRRTARRARLHEGRRLSHQRAQTRAAHRDELDDPAQFFDGVGDQSEPGPALRDALARDFGSFERWRSEFVPMGKALGGGSGWVLLSWSPRDRKLVNQWASDHCHTLAGGTPILALDMYEHSYHMDFGAKAASYVDTFMDVIRWNNVEQLFVQTT